MSRKSEETLAAWTGPASDAEQARYDWTRNQINEALEGHTFGGFSFKVYPKGSYPNRTNVVRDSDVDIAVELTGLTRHSFVHDASSLTLSDFGLTPYTGTYSVKAFKDDVQAALIRQFGVNNIKRGNKALHVQESTRGLKADVVVCQTLDSHHSRYSGHKGIQIHADDNKIIDNFPKQHLDEGLAKNDATSKNYKRTVRILKRLENEMVENGVLSVVPSFLIESLVWNVPNPVLINAQTWTERVKLSLAHILLEQDDQWLEANNIKFLFHSTQKWSAEQAKNFAASAWTYLEFS